MENKWVFGMLFVGSVFAAKPRPLLEVRVGRLDPATQVKVSDSCLIYADTPGIDWKKIAILVREAWPSDVERVPLKKRQIPSIEVNAFKHSWSPKKGDTYFPYRLKHLAELKIVRKGKAARSLIRTAERICDEHQGR